MYLRVIYALVRSYFVTYGRSRCSLFISSFLSIYDIIMNSSDLYQISTVLFEDQTCRMYSYVTYVYVRDILNSKIPLAELEIGSGYTVALILSYVRYHFMLPYIATVLIHVYPFTFSLPFHALLPSKSSSLTPSPPPCLGCRSFDDLFRQFLSALSRTTDGASIVLSKYRQWYFFESFRVTELFGY